MSGRVRTERSGAVATVYLDNPQRRNAMDFEMYAAVPEAVGPLSVDDTLRAVVLRGAGKKAFGAGSDISEFRARRMGDAAERYARVERDAQRAIAALPVPVLALIHGSCMGGGAAIALAADLRYAADDARFAVPPARLGVGFPPDAVAGLIRVVGQARALELLFTGSPIDAHEALRIGLVNAVVRKAELDDHVAAVAEQIALNAPLTVRSLKLIAGELTKPADERNTDEMSATVAACFASDDYREGITAFAEKRAPAFEGR